MTDTIQTAQSSPHSGFSPFALTGIALAVLAALAAALSGFGTRWGWWHFSTGFVILRWAAIGGLAAALISLTGSFLVTRPGAERRGFALAIIGLVIGLTVAGIPLKWLTAALRAPRIHDISTDTEHPPRFVAAVPLRENAPNPMEYGGPAIAAQQHAAYPDVKPALLPLPPDKAFERALAAARKMGWQIVDANGKEGRIEAVDTTFWFGFKDDIMVRITPQAGGCRVDVRSLSRVGLSDVGTNAKRVMKYLKQLAVEK